MLVFHSSMLTVFQKHSSILACADHYLLWWLLVDLMEAQMLAGAVVENEPM
jgi:hypothetical protein